MSAPRAQRLGVAGLLVAAVAAVLRVDDVVEPELARDLHGVVAARVVDDDDVVHDAAVDLGDGLRERRPRCTRASRRRRASADHDGTSLWRPAVYRSPPALTPHRSAVASPGSCPPARIRIAMCECFAHATTSRTRRVRGRAVQLVWRRRHRPAPAAEALGAYYPAGYYGVPSRPRFPGRRGEGAACAGTPARAGGRGDRWPAGPGARHRLRPRVPARMRSGSAGGRCTGWS